MLLSFISCLACYFFIKNSFKKKLKNLSLLITIIFYLNLIFLIIYCFLNYLSGDGINDAIIFHIVFGIKGFGINEYITPFLLLTIGIIFLILSFKCFLKSTINHQEKDTYTRPVIGIFLLFIFILTNPFYTDIYKLINEKDYKFNEDENFFHDQEILFKKEKKNVIFLYLEQIERTYLDENIFPGLTPNLSNLEKMSITFTNIDSPRATNWTIAGMAASQCGISLFTPVASENSMAGVDEFLPLAKCLGDILDNEEYELHYIGGSDLDFAGKGNFYKTHGFDIVQGWYELEPSLVDSTYRSPWGVFDDELLQIISKRLNNLDKAYKNFGLFSLTLDTHHPYGYISKSCADMPYKDGKNQILNSVHCVDFIVGDFIRKFLSSNLYDNTVLVVLSDHLALKNTASNLLNKKDRKNLFMIFDKASSPIKVDDIGNTFDIGPTVLGLLGSNTIGLGLGRNLLFTDSLSKNHNIDNIINKNKKKILELWSFPKLEKGFKISDQNKIFFGERYIKFPALIILDSKNEVEQIMFDFYYANPLKNKVNEINKNLNFIWIDDCKKINNYLKIDKISYKDSYCVLLEDKINKKSQNFSISNEILDNVFIKNYFKK